VYDQSLLEGQCAFIALTVIDYERRRMPVPFSEEQLWEYNVTRAVLGCLSEQEFAGLANDLLAQRREANNSRSEHVRLSRAFAFMLRHNSDLTHAMDHQNSVSVRVLHEHRKRDSPFRWHPLLFVAFLLSNSKGRYRVIVKPSRDFFHHSGEMGFEIRIAANQGHTRVSSTMVEETLGAPLDVQKCKELGHIFHAAHNRNFEAIKRDGLLLAETRQPGQTNRVTIHMVYAGGTVAGKEGTHMMTGPHLFYAELDYEAFLEYGNRL
jgi:RNA:NAD 2'-phosphotransferase (TPT1/KptA family)